MAEENQNKSHEYETTTEVEIKDRGIFDFLGKKKEEEKPQEEVIVTEFNKVKVSDEPKTKVEEKKEEHGEKKHSLLEKLHRSSSSSSSSSDEEEKGEGGEKKKKKKEKKGLKEKIQEKIDHKEEKKHDEDTVVTVEKVEVDPAYPDQEKKGFIDKIKEKLPGQFRNKLLGFLCYHCLQLQGTPKFSTNRRHFKFEYIFSFKHLSTQCSTKKEKDTRVITHKLPMTGVILARRIF